ncbi:MAG: hypothetical protein S4CHLAM45_08480 [Chlamydiales bacterium]|nr:hypothetical protein [Chlamydiales bacterium]MCH9620402.1 hypothetical protein [Chlamydiales bacterium]MCH9622952.1 hypothetical protein [Chlamydiales bacterium]
MFGPSKTPQPVKTVIGITTALSILAPILTMILLHSFKMMGPGAWFALSRFGILQGWIWQPLTYFFIQSAGVGISFGFLLSLFFHMFILWFAGSEIAHRYGSKAFVFFYLSAGLIPGLIGAAAQFLLGSNAILVGSSPPIFALLTVWGMLYPNMELFFLFVIRMKAKWLVLAILGFSLFMNLSYGEWIPLIADISGILWGFVIARFTWKLNLPFKN